MPNSASISKPTPKAIIPKVIINDRSAARLRAGHAWVYASDVMNDGTAVPGALVHVVNTKGRLQGSAVFSSSSQIKLRMMANHAVGSESELLDLLAARLREAVNYRKLIVRDSNACRLVFSEADRIPGLVVDRYNDVISLQILTQAWDRPERRAAIV